MCSTTYSKNSLDRLPVRNAELSNRRLSSTRTALLMRLVELSAAAFNHLGAEFYHKPFVIAGVNPYPAQRTIAQWFDPAAFSIPPASCYCYGNSGRDVLTGPRSSNLDLTAAKRFHITESANLAFRAEFFNALNHPQFAIPGNTTIGSNGVGSISATARPSRQIQFALRLVF